MAHYPPFPAPPAPAIIGPEFDYLATRRPSDDPVWRSSTPTKKSAVIAVMRDEGMSILEWVAHYRLLGFDTIFVYTNDNIDKSDALLLALHESGVIRLSWNTTPPDLSAQFKAYRHAFWFSPEVWEHEWLSFLDADEFLIPMIDGAVVPLDTYLDHVWDRYAASSISLNWRWFPGSGEFAYAPGLLVERFRQAFWQRHVKTIFRPRDTADVQVHHVELREGRSINGGGLSRAASPHEPPIWSLGRVNHYWNRSFQEFYVKRQRGRAASDRAPRDWDLFFQWNGPTTPETIPGPAHVVRLHAEMDRLRQLPNVAQAERAVVAEFLRRVSLSEVRTIYEEARAQRPQPQGPSIVWPTD